MTARDVSDGLAMTGFVLLFLALMCCFGATGRNTLGRLAMTIVFIATAVFLAAIWVGVSA